MPSKPAMARPGADTDETRAKNDHFASKKQAVRTYGFNVHPTSTGEKPQANNDQPHIDRRKMTSFCSNALLGSGPQKHEHAQH